MVFQKLKKISAMTLAAAMVVTSVPVSDYTSILASAKGQTDSGKSVVSVDGSDLQEDEAGVYKVTMDENGNLTSDTDYDPYGELAGNENTPFSWDNVNMYFVITDRFKNGDKSNDHSYGRSATSSTVSEIKDSENKENAADTFKAVAGDYASKGEKGANNYETGIGTFHGGDLKGLTEYIENGYFDALGTNAIWITAPYEQVHGAMCGNEFKHYAYHGYYALDYTEVDANMGTSEELHKFIDTAHEHGIRVVFDVVMNHTGYPDAYTIAEYYGADSPLLSSNWRDIYFNTEEANLHWYDDYANIDPGKGRGNIAYNEAWNSSYYGTSWLRMVENRFSSGYTAKESGDEVTYCSAGLPDFKTESGEKLGIPDVLQKKWTKEGRLSEKTAETKAMLSACGYGPDSATVKQYLVAWLSNWVREYGVDGFRCDTAKHVGIDCWSDLKEQGKKALKEWRANNKDKACSAWTDDFWMTGEVYSQGLSMNYGGTDYSQAFDSLINFNFQGNENKSGSSLESVYSEYSQYARSSATGDPLSYISSHDKGIGGRGANPGTALLLCPGGVQVYYGDETSRQPGPGPEDQPSRSQMTWNNASCLEHWQKIGHFRRNHISVGAGVHEKLSDSPYTFARTYSGKATVGSESKTDYEDKVVVALPCGAGTYDVTVSGVFADGTTLVDEYTGETYTVSGGKVSVTTSSSEQAILLAEPQESQGPTLKAKVSASKAAGTYNEDKFEVTFTTENITDAKLEINGVHTVAFENGIATVTIGEDTAYEEETVIKVTGKSEIDGSDVAKEFKYTRSAAPVIGGAASAFKVRIKKDIFGSVPTIWLWSDSVKQYTDKAWPGDSMTVEGDYYVYTCDKITGEVTAIVCDGGSDDAHKKFDGITLKGNCEVDAGGTVKEVPAESTGKECTVTVKYVNGNDNTALKTITRVGAEGDSYTVYAPNMLSDLSGYQLAQGQETSKTGKFSATETTVEFVYTKNGEVISTPVPVTPEPTDDDPTPTPTNDDPTPEPTDDDPTPTPTNGDATTTPIVDDTTPTPVPTDRPSTPTPSANTTIAPVMTATVAPTQVPTNTPANNNATQVPLVNIEAPDAPAAPATEAPKANTAAVSVSLAADPGDSVLVGNPVKLTATATGGSLKFTYKFRVDDESGAKAAERPYSTTNTFTWIPVDAGNYTVTAFVLDTTTNKEVKTSINYNVTQLAKSLRISKFTMSRLKRMAYKIDAKAIGGKSGYNYKFTAKYKGKTIVLKNYSAKKTFKYKFKKKGQYVITLYVKDASGKVVKKSKTIKVK